MLNNCNSTNHSRMAFVIRTYEELSTAPLNDMPIDDMTYQIRRKNGKPVTYNRCVKKIQKHLTDMLVLLVSTQYIAREKTKHCTRAYFFDTERERDEFIKGYMSKGDDDTIEAIESDELIDYVSPYSTNPEYYCVLNDGIPVFSCDSLQAD